ncbi:ferredoxin [Nocardia sp. NPDC058058]|uniref:ferredoxin n=1 Tax=Nocardia sp. NPDC058058 TaxID=3346317 RepID=UPI0036D9C64D
MRVVVNPDLCVGNGLCEVVAPALFEVGDDGVARVLSPEIADSAIDLAERAVIACPARALRVE